MDWLGVGIFCGTYALISARKIASLGLDRPAAALLGAVAYVACGRLSPEAAMSAIDGDTLLLLFGVMGMGTFLATDGFFEQLERRLGRVGSAKQLLAIVIWGAGGLSALITNDAVCVLGGPFLVRLIQRHKLPALPFLLALASAANTGSAASLVGNPQNMLCARLGELAFLSYSQVALPITIAALAINHGVLLLLYRRELRARIEAAQPAPKEGRSCSSEPWTRGQLLTLSVLALTIVCYGAGASLAWTAVGGFSVLLLLKRQDASALWKHIDGSLLLFFAALFVVIAGLEASGAVAQLLAWAPLTQLEEPTGLGLSGAFIVGSNLVSNVPFILLIQDQIHALSDPQGGWTLLAIISTFAGNLTLLGSAANVIVAEAGREVGGIGFFEHLRAGALITLLTSVMAALALSALSHL